MKVRSGTTLWSDLSPSKLTLSPFEGECRCQVLVLGGGITGALVAHELVASGIEVVLLDRGEIGRGSTAASTGLLQYEVDTPLVDLIKKVGHEHAVHAYRRGLSAIDEIEQLVEELGDSCGFSRRPSLYFATSCWHERRLRREFECRRRFGIEVDLLSREQIAEISSIPATAAIWSKGDAQIDPLRFTQRLVEAAIRQGLKAYANSRVTGIEEGGDGVTIQTDKGTIRAQKIVFATGYESEQHLDQSKANLNSTYAVASQPNLFIPGWPEECLIWETARPYFYARRTPDLRAIIGGEDTEFSNDHARDELVDRKVESLIARFQKLFPNVDFTPEYSWGGTFAETKDGLAYIGQPPNRPSTYFALGYGGNGITFSVIAARLIRDLYLGRPNADAQVFRFGR